MNIKYIIYDMDGLLLNTEPVYTRVTSDICAAHGKEYTWDHKANMLGQDALKSSEYLVNTLELPMLPHEFREHKDDLLRELLPHVDAMPGAKALTALLKHHGVPQAVGTSSTQELFKVKTSKHQDWFKTFDAIVTCDHPEVGAAKPSPDIFLTAARALQAKPEQCLVFEDAASGVAAAKTAGMHVIAIPDPHINKAYYADADRILNSLLEFKPEDYGLIKL